MHLALDDDSEMLRSTLRAFARDRLRPRCREWDETAALPEEALREGWALGLVAAGIPTRFGGAAQTPDARPSAVTGALALEELAWGDLAYATVLLAPNHLAVPVAIFGSEEDKARYLPSLASEKRPSVGAAWIEPGRTHDLANLGATALAGKLAGTKAFAHQAASRVVYARGEAGGRGFQGVSAFLADAGSGLASAQPEDAIGLRAATLERLSLDGATGRPLGPIDYRALSARALTASAAAAVGVARASWEYAAAYAKERVAFGRPIAQYQSIAFMIAEAATDAEAAHWMTLKAAWRIDRGEEALPAAALAFRFATDAAWRIADHGVQILGGHGVIRDHLAELFFRNARTLAVTPGLLIV